MGTLGVVVSSMVMDSHSSQCLCLNALPSCNLSGGDLALHRNSSSTSLCRRQIKTPCSLELSTSFLDRRGLGKGQRGNFSSLKKQKQPKKRGFKAIYSQLMKCSLPAANSQLFHIQSCDDCSRPASGNEPSTVSMAQWVSPSSSNVSP